MNQVKGKESALPAERQLSTESDEKAVVSMSGKNHKTGDPLYHLFEHHLMTRSYEDSAVFTKEVADKYLAYLDSTLAHIPFHVRGGVSEDLEAEAHEMLVKKMYGVAQGSDHQHLGKVIKIQRNKFNYFDFSPATGTDENAPKKR